MKELVLLGASGSIGRQTIDIVLQHPDLFHIQALSVGHHTECLDSYLRDLDVKLVCVQEEENIPSLQQKFPDVTFISGDEGLNQLAVLENYDVLVNALVGFCWFYAYIKSY